MVRLKILRAIFEHPGFAGLSKDPEQSAIALTGIITDLRANARRSRMPSPPEAASQRLNQLAAKAVGDR
jgi:hypothetical protein